MRLLHRLGRHDDVAEADIAALELRRVLGPELAERRHVFIGDGAALGKGRRAHGLEFLLHPAGADADGKPPV